MKVKDRMTFNPYTTSPDQSVGDLWRFMQEHNLNRLPVVDRGKLLGIVTRTDFGTRPDIDLRGTSLATRLLPDEQEEKLRKIKVRDLMPPNQQIISIHQDAYIEQAAKILRDNRISGLPVVDDDGMLVGIITQTDVTDAFLDMLGINRAGTRINLRVSADAENLVRIGQVLMQHKLSVENLVSIEKPDKSRILVLRVNMQDSRQLIKDLKDAGFQIESLLVKN